MTGNNAANQANRTSSPHRDGFKLPNGQRVPVLFRLKNIQATSPARLVPQSADAPKSDSVAATTANIGSKDVGTRVDSAHTNVSNSIDRDTVIAGPSWMRRNAYRVTVLCLLLVTIGLLSSNHTRGRNDLQVTEKPSSVTLTKSSDLAIGLENPQSLVVETAPNLPASIALNPTEDPKQNLTIEPPPAVEMPKLLAQNSGLTNAQTTKVESPDLSGAANENAKPLAKPALLIGSSDEPKMTSEFLTLRPNAEPKSNSAITKENEAAAAKLPTSTTNVSISESMNRSTLAVQPVSTDAARNASQLPTATTANRYATAPNQTSSPQFTSPQSAAGQATVRQTNVPDMDTQALYSLLQGYEQQSPEDAIRSARQASSYNVGYSPDAPNGTTTAGNVPWSPPTPSNNLYTQSGAATGVEIPQTSAPNQVVKQGYVPIGSSLVEASGMNAPQPSGYVPIGANAAPMQNQDPTLYPVASVPGLDNLNQPQRPNAYQPLYPVANPNMNPAPTFGTVPKVADQNAAGPYQPIGTTSGYGFSR